MKRDLVEERRHGKVSKLLMLVSIFYWTVFSFAVWHTSCIFIYVFNKVKNVKDIDLVVVSLTINWYMDT